jgi:hypothetical protein
MASKQHVVRLYRDVLHAAKRFPSKKRDSIVADIKLEFREARRRPCPARVLRRAVSVHTGSANSVKIVAQHPARLAPSPDAHTVVQGAVETDAANVQRRLAVAQDGLSRLRQYAGARRAVFLSAPLAAAVAETPPRGLSQA